MPLAELLLSSRELIRAMEDTFRTFSPVTLQEAIISALSQLQVCDPDKEEVYIMFDEKYIDYTPKDEYWNYTHPLPLKVKEEV